MHPIAQEIRFFYPAASMRDSGHDVKKTNSQEPFGMYRGTRR